jgi:hypothetical protein
MVPVSAVTPAKPSQQAQTPAPDANSEDEQVLSWPEAILNWLHSENGKEASSKIASILESFATGSARSHQLAMVHVIARYILVGLAIGAAVALRWHDKLDSTIIGLLSLTVGYLIGKQKSD